MEEIHRSVIAAIRRDPPEVSGASSVTGVRLVSGVALLAAAGVIAWQAAEGSAPDATTLGALVVAIAALAAIIGPRAFVLGVRRVTQVDLLGVSVTLQLETARTTIAKFVVEEHGAPVPPRPAASDPRAALALVEEELRRKLRFCSEAVLGDPKGSDEELIVVDLGVQRLLDLDEVRLCLDLLDDLARIVVPLDPHDQSTFLDQAWEFAVRFATRTFDRHARRSFDRAGWLVADIAQGPGHRPDFLVACGGRAAFIAARVAAPAEGLFRTRNRITRTRREASSQLPDAPFVIVIPDHVDNVWAEVKLAPVSLGEDVMVVQLGHLLTDPDVVALDPTRLHRVPDPAEIPSTNE